MTAADSILQFGEDLTAGTDIYGVFPYAQEKLFEVISRRVAHKRGKYQLVLHGSKLVVEGHGEEDLCQNEDPPYERYFMLGEDSAYSDCIESLPKDIHAEFVPVSAYNSAKLSDYEDDSDGFSAVTNGMSERELGKEVLPDIDPLFYHIRGLLEDVGEIISDDPYGENGTSLMLFCLTSKVLGKMSRKDLKVMQCHTMFDEWYYKYYCGVSKGTFYIATFIGMDGSGSDIDSCGINALSLEGYAVLMSMYRKYCRKENHG
jgi:hypothetical protein